MPDTVFQPGRLGHLKSLARNVPRHVVVSNKLPMQGVKQPPSSQFDILFAACVSQCLDQMGAIAACQYFDDLQRRGV